jgi:acyl-CoA reductase-like NAD-dependent aldehyde dehydrogenase
VEAHVSDAVAKGAKILAGGGRPELPDPLKGGNFHSPTLLTEATIDMWVFLGRGRRRWWVRGLGWAAC